MKSIKFLMGCLCGVIWLLGMTFPALAMDSEGCLSCHQYPGLVRLDEKHVLKVVHIDEARYLASPHGKLTCRQCHTAINQVPHTGVSQVNCNTQCHTNEKDKAKIKNFPLAGFHQKEQSAITSLTDDSSCRVCHVLYPHYENHMVRALLNMHNGFMHCTVCHLKKENHADYRYLWNGAESAQFSGEPFGTFYNPNLKKAQKSKDFISRITVFTTIDGQSRALMNSSDVAEAKAFLEKEKNLKADERKQRLAYFHRDINRKEISVACDECHSTHSILDFAQLGFDEKAHHNLISINLKGLVTHYKTFYFPQMFEK